MQRRREARAVAAAVAAFFALAVPAAAAPVYKATIQRSAYGVPHITARNIESLAAGFAYAFAQDNICAIANESVTVRGERSKFFGPDAKWFFSGDGSTYKNFDADFYFEWVKQTKAVEKLIAEKPPLGPTDEVRRGVRGYVAGYNRYLRSAGGGKGIPDPRCMGAPWVGPIEELDVYRRFYQLGILASSGAVFPGIANAKPSSPAAASAQQARQDDMLANSDALSRLQPQIGSNAYGFGADATQNHRGLLLGNPHFPWDGSERLYQAHLRIPGQIDVAGATLYGVPLILIGHTRSLAWSHTVATAWRFTPFKLSLPPGDPYSYVVDGQTKPMTATKVTVKAKADDGKLEDRSTTIYSTEYGPMVTDLVGIPLPWSDGSGFALRDVNATNFRYLNHFIENNKAKSVAEYDRIERKYQGIPWVNSLAADSSGNAYYSMQGAIPNVPDELADRCNVAQPAFDLLGLPILDGSHSDCNWQNSDGAVAPGTFPPDKVPTLIRRDYVHNGNDSHWLTNPAQPLTGFDRIIGIEDAERTFRTRIGLIQIGQRLAGTDGLPGKGFTRQLLEQVALGDRQYLGELWRDSLVSMCESAPGGHLFGSSGPVDVSGACPVLKAWDLHDNLDSRGAILFRRFASRALGNFRSLPTGLQGSVAPGAQSLWTNQYSNDDPVNTPNGLNTANPAVQRALADAVTDLQGAKIPLDAPLRDWQYEERGGERIPIHGGPGTLGVFNAINVVWDPKNGYGNVPHGSSFIMVAEFTGNHRCPVHADTFVTYGESENQRSKHAADYTKAFSEKRWNHPPYCASEMKRLAGKPRRLVIR
jgi:acyl-homoserine-lactone acylase